MSDNSESPSKRQKRLAEQSPTGTAAQPRHTWGPRSLGAVLPPLLRPSFRKRGPATAQVIADWDSIVGSTIAAVALPRRLAAGTLTIACGGPSALELQHLSGVLIERINTHVGHELVQRLRFVQEVPIVAPRTAAPPPSLQARQDAEAAVRDLPAGDLRDALAALGRAVLTRRRA